MLKLRIISAEGCLFDSEVDAVFFPSSLGEFEVLPHHADLISTLCEGEIRIRKDGAESRIAIRSGIVRIEKQVIISCVEV
ncbi:MAG: FoF1 ATP synthase subunit delta/epsilon [Candidatus Cryptobacteroides sp.]